MKRALLAVPLLVVLACKEKPRDSGTGGTDGSNSSGSTDTAAARFASGMGSLVGAAVDGAGGTVWLYGGGDSLQAFTRAGAPGPSVEAPGERADDVDIEFTTDTLTLGTTPVPAGSLLFINGESGPAEIYAVHPTTGAVIATLETQFGAGHVVGGAWHTGRRTFFLVQDNQPAAPEANRIAEIDPATGRVVSSFLLADRFSVHYGDLEVHGATGNLLVVSSSETRLAEFTPAGELVRYVALPEGISSLSGIGLDDARGEAWVSSTGGNVWRLSGFARPSP